MERKASYSAMEGVDYIFSSLGIWLMVRAGLHVKKVERERWLGYLTRWFDGDE